jgi:hypothetical protein
VSGFPTKTLYTFRVSLMSTILPSLFILLDLISLILFGKVLNRTATGVPGV